MNLSRALAPSFRISLAVLSAGALHSAVLAAGADDAQKAPAPAQQTPAPAQQTPATPAEQRVAADVAKVTEQYLVAPKAASELGCRIEWQTAASVPAGGALRKVDSSADAVLALNNRNDLTLIRPETGDAAWTVSAADPIDRVIRMGVFSYAGRGGDESSRISVMTDAVFYALGFDSGSTLARSRFRHVPNTTAEQWGNFLVFGTSSGQITWFNCATGNDTRGHVIDSLSGGAPITAAPAVAEGDVVGGNTAGGLTALDASTGRMRWSKRLLAGVVATPAIGGGATFVASEDQYLYAFDLATGATLWKYFTQTPLRSSPFLAGDLVVQDVPGEGLLALTQNPEAQPGGEVRWRRDSVHGSPVCTLDGGILFWCPKGRMATLVSVRNGATLRTISLPAVEHLEAGSIEEGGFVAWSSDGRIERLSPISEATGETAAKN